MTDAERVRGMFAHVDKATPGEWFVVRRKMTKKAKQVFTMVRTADGPGGERVVGWMGFGEEVVGEKFCANADHIAACDPAAAQALRRVLGRLRDRLVATHCFCPAAGEPCPRCVDKATLDEILGARE